MSDLTPQQRRQQRTRAAILAAAREIIKESGADKLSIRGIAKRIDYSPAGLYEYFAGKEAIIEALCERGEAQLTAYLRRVPADMAIEARWPAMLQAYVDFARENPEFFTLMFMTLSVGTETPDDWGESDYPESSFAILYNMIEEAIAAGYIYRRPGYDTFEIAYSVWSLAHGMAVLQTGYLQNLQFDFAAADYQAARVFLAGLRQPPE